MKIIEVQLKKTASKQDCHYHMQPPEQQLAVCNGKKARAAKWREVITLIVPLHRQLIHINYSSCKPVTLRCCAQLSGGP